MRESEPLGLLLDEAQDKIVVVDEAGTFTYVNEAARRILGFDPDDLLGENVFEYIHPDDVAAVRRTFNQAIRSDSPTGVTVEYRHRTNDGAWVWLESRMSSVPDSALDGFVVSSRDVTDRVRAEREREEAAASLEEIAAVSGDVLWLFTADWSELLFVNPAYEDVYGRPAEELEADPASFLETIHPDDVPVVTDAMEYLSDGNAADIEYRVNPAENYNRWVWVQGQPITRDGEVVRITGFSRDITDRQRRERQLYVMDNLLRHNLRNDLNVIIGTANFIEEEVPETAERTAVIRRTGEDLLSSAQKQREIIALINEPRQREHIDLQAMVAEAVETVRDRYPDAAIDVGALDAAPVRGRPELAEAVVELLENAIRHQEVPAPRVTIQLRRAGRHVELVVGDAGRPIPPAEADVLRGEHEMTDVYHSSGLGFWLVYWSVELSDGAIAVESKEGKGNRITVTLPSDIR